MLLNKFKLSRFKNPRRHILILDALIGQNRGRQIPLQIHMAQPLHIEGGDGVVAVPKGLQGRPRHGAQRGQQPPRLGQKLRQALPGQLEKVAHLLNECNANVVAVDHNQFKNFARFSEVELRVTCETNGESHIDTIIETFKQNGLEIHRVN